MLEFKIFLHIHMIFNFQYTRVSSGVIYRHSVFPTQYLTLFCVLSDVDMDARPRCSDF
jgi:hypothetical protein